MADVPDSLIDAVTHYESGGDKYAVSPTGAAGLMQLEPATAKELGVTNRFDPAQNRKAGTKYLSQLIDKYGDPEKALVAYNWGPGNVDQHGVEKAPASSKEYASKVLTKAGLKKGAPVTSNIDDFLDGNASPVKATAKASTNHIDDFLGSPDDGHSSEEYEDPSVPKIGPDGKLDRRPTKAQRKAAAAKPAADEGGLWSEIKGAGQAARAVVQNTAAQMAGNVAGVYKAMTGGKLGDEQGNREAEKYGSKVADKLSYTPTTAAGRRDVEKLGDVMEATGVNGLPIGPEMTAAGALAKPAIGQAARAAGEALGPEIYAAKNLASKVKLPSVVPKLSPEKAELAQKALDMGVTIPPHMLSDNEFVRMAGEFVDNLPLSGSTKAKNKAAFNSFLAKQIGEEGDVKALTPAVFARAQRRAGQVIGDTFDNLAVPADDPALKKDVADISASLGRELDDTKSIIDGNIGELDRLAAENGGVIPGSSLKKLHSEVAAKLRGDLTKYPGMREKLSDFKGILEDAAARQIKDPEVADAYQTARVQYAKSKVLEPLVAKNDVTGVKPADLLGRMNATAEGKHRMATQAAGELGDAAAVAQNFIREEPASKAAGRGFVLGALTEAAGAGKAVLGVAAGNIYNRFGPRIAKRIIEGSLPKKAAAGAPEGLSLAEPGPLTEAPAFAPKPYADRGLLSLADATPSTPPAAEPGLPYPSKLSLQQPGTPAPTAPYTGPLSLAPKEAGLPADQAFATRADVPSIEPPGSPLAKPSVLQLADKQAPHAGTPPEKALATNHTHPTDEFELRQEVLQRPEFSTVIDAYKAEAEALQTKAKNATNPKVRQKAMKDLRELQADFAAGMKQFGIETAQDAHGLLRPLYESKASTGLEKTQLPIKKTYTMGEGGQP